MCIQCISVYCTVNCCILYSVLLYTVQCNAVCLYSVLLYTVQCNAVCLYSVLLYTVQCNAVCFLGMGIVNIFISRYRTHVSRYVSWYFLKNEPLIYLHWNEINNNESHHKNNDTQYRVFKNVPGRRRNYYFCCKNSCTCGLTLLLLVVYIFVMSLCTKSNVFI